MKVNRSKESEKWKLVEKIRGGKNKKRLGSVHETKVMSASI